MVKLLGLLVLCLSVYGCHAIPWSNNDSDRLYIKTEDGTYVFMDDPNADIVDGSEKVSIMTYERTLPVPVGTPEDMPKDVREKLRDAFPDLSRSTPGIADQSGRVAKENCGVFLLPNIRIIPPLPDPTSENESSWKAERKLLIEYIGSLRQWGNSTVKDIKDKHKEYLQGCLKK